MQRLDFHELNLQVWISRKDNLLFQTRLNPGAQCLREDKKHEWLTCKNTEIEETTGCMKENWNLKVEHYSQYSPMRKQQTLKRQLTSLPKGWELDHGLPEDLQVKKNMSHKTGLLGTSKEDKTSKLVPESMDMELWDGLMLLTQTVMQWSYENRELP